MLAFRLTPENACLFYEVCQELDAKTEKERIAILQAMAKLGKVDSITQTPMSKDEYIAHLAKNFKVLKVDNTNASQQPKQ